MYNPKKQIEDNLTMQHNTLNGVRLSLLLAARSTRRIGRDAPHPALALPRPTLTNCVDCLQVCTLLIRLGQTLIYAVRVIRDITYQLRQIIRIADV